MSVAQACDMTADLNYFPPNPYAHYAISATKELVPEWPSLADAELVSWPAMLQPIFYEILFHLDVVEVIRMRRVCKFLYYMSHERALWAYLLRQADPSLLPPLAPVLETGPVLQGVPKSLSALAIERILVRAASLQANFARPSPRPLRVWAHETFARIVDMVLLPGSEHLVAVQEDVQTESYSIVLYKLDCHHDAEAMAAVPLSGRPVPGTLQAKYMTVGGVLGLTAVCIQKWAEVTVRKLDGMTTSTTMYECRATHMCLDTMEQLAAAYPPESLDHMWLSITLPVACKTLEMPPPSHSPLSAPTLGMLFGKPVVAFAQVTGTITNELYIQCLDGGQPHVMVIAPPADIRMNSYRQWRIKALRILEKQQSMLVVSQYISPGAYTLPAEPLAHRIDVFPIQPSGAPGPSHVDTEDPGVLVHILDTFGRQVRCTDTPIPVAPEHSLYAASGIKQDNATPPVHVYVHARLQNSAHDPTTPRFLAQKLACLPEPVRSWWTFDDTLGDFSLDGYCSDMRILSGAGAGPALLYKVSRESWRNPTPDAWAAERVLGVYVGRDGGATREVEGVVERLNWAGPSRGRRGGGADEAGIVGALAWDDTTGRLIVAHPERTALKVFDFAKMAQLDSQGDRWPIPVARMTKNGPPCAPLLRSPEGTYQIASLMW
ncbi:hypothetical protein C2E23DRAFT_272237 [Lenzites betulinus]|nr:hypothetical protein C2E23DRAFT_272237 [Lenzites betulinus]